MKKKKILKIFLIVITTILVLIGSLLLFGYFYFENAYSTENKPYKNYIGYIDQSKALLNDKYELCNEGSIYHTYSGASLKAYKGDKKQFRDAINSTFNKNEYTDSGYVNFRFLVNCEGNAGWFEIIEMDLDLNETSLNANMVNELLEFTSKPGQWNVISYDNKPQNYYMYVSYRIENGKVTEIIP